VSLFELGPLNMLLSQLACRSPALSRWRAQSADGAGASDSFEDPPLGVDYEEGDARYLDAKTRKLVASAVDLLASHTASYRANSVRYLHEFSGLDDFEAALVLAGGIAPLLRALGTPQSDSSVHEGAARLVRHLIGTSLSARRTLVAAGCITPLISLIGSGLESVQTREDAAIALCYIVEDDDAAGATAVALSGGIPPLVTQLRSRTIGAHVVVETLLRMSGDDANAVAIASAGGIPVLLDLMVAPGGCAAKEDAAATLFNVSVITANKGAIVAAGGIPELVDVLMSSSAVTVHNHAVATMRQLADESVDAASTIATSGGIPPLVVLLKSPCVDVHANALGTLVVLSSANESTGLVVAAAGAIPAAIALLKPSCLPGIRALSSRLLFVLAGSTTDECIKGAISAISATRCAPLIELLKDEAPEYRAAGCRALRALASDRAARAALVSAGAQAALASLLSDDSGVRECVTVAVAALERGPGMK
jgi:hypothetical protein